MIGPPPPYTPTHVRCASCRYVYAFSKMLKRGEQWFCKDAKACAERILARKREREIQRAWK